MKENLFLSYPGVICGAGNNAEQLWASCVTANQDGIKTVKAISGKEFFAGHIDDKELFPVTDERFDMRVIRIIDNALAQIMPQVEKVKAKYLPERIAVCIGCCDNGSELSFKGHKVFFESGKFDGDYDLRMQSAQYPAAFIKEKTGVKGPAFVFSTACSSSGSAVVKAKELILSGICDAVICGGADVASDTVLLGFDGLEAVSEQKTIPFSKNRSGITLGEGAALFVLAKDRALVENDGFAAVLLGTGESSDASHMTAPLEDGSGASLAIKNALKDSGLKPEDVEYINLHGTGTHLNDAMEAKAVKAVFGEYASKIPVSSTKPLTGHTLGAASSVELAVCYMALKNSKEKKLPVHVWDGVFDDEIPALNFVTKDFLNNKEITIAMSNSFGFGGCNVSLVIGK